MQCTAYSESIKAAQRPAKNTENEEIIRASDLTKKNCMLAHTCDPIFFGAKICLQHWHMTEFQKRLVPMKGSDLELVWQSAKTSGRELPMVRASHTPMVTGVFLVLNR
ncbi:MAG: hypothetical protein JWN45_2731 [Acidobacteriaceae bacterium]|nr:hypothetical protein [Acidobacteriaceae bacterium]